MEALLVLLIGSILMIPVSQSRPSARIGMETLEKRMVHEQAKAFGCRSRRKVQIEGSNMITQEETISLAPLICEPFTIHFNAKGNPDKAGTIVCDDGSESWNLVIQLGSGRMRTEQAGEDS